MGLFRLLLALAVVAAHAGPAFGLDWLALTGGPLAVQIFYVISGFYMALVLNEKYVGEGAYFTFVRARLWRLLPVFWVVLVATLLAAFVIHAACGRDIPPLAHWRAHGAAMPWSHWLGLLLVNGTIVGQDVVSFLALDPVQHELFFTADFQRAALPAWRFLFVPQAWTVGVELMFYAVAPCLVRRRSGVLLALIAASLMLRVGLMHKFRLGHDPWTYRFFPTELALFLAGAWAWRCHGFLQRRGWLRPWLCASAGAIAIALVSTYPLWPAPAQAAPYGLPGLLAAVPLLLPFVFESTRRLGFDRELGELSYPVYLVHYPLVFCIGALDIPWLAEHRGAVVLVASLVLAHLLWRGVGRRLEASRQSFSTRRAGLRT